MELKFKKSLKKKSPLRFQWRWHKINSKRKNKALGEKRKREERVPVNGHKRQHLNAGSKPKKSAARTKYLI